MDMAIRVFRCSECGHKMRVTGEACGYCHAPKLVHQRLGVYLGIGAAIVVAALFYNAFG